MRSNSGKDEARNNLHDPTPRDRDHERGQTRSSTKRPSAQADQGGGHKD